MGRPSGKRPPETLIQPGELAVTEQYIIGELSVRLVQLEAVAPSEEFAYEFARLRVEAEKAPFETLPYMALHALHLIRGLCRDSLARGDLRALSSQATMAAELREFAISAMLLAEG
jgi:hypothetical protein